MFLYSRFYFGFFESVFNVIKLLSLALQFVNKFTLCSFNRNFGIFSLLSFGNSPLFPAKQQRKSTQKQFSNNSER